jgi:DNA/RNA endonuclease YhcR with UshA esterase domain
MLRRILLLSLVLVFAAAGASAQNCADIHSANNGCAPSPYDGASVSLTGNVYVQAGTYNSGSVYMQCPNGGMTFFDSSTGGVIFEGDNITVTGTVSAYGDEIQFASGATVVLNSSGNALNAIAIGTNDLADGSDQFGNFMKVQGVLSLVSSGFNSIYEVDDGSGPVTVFVDGTTGIDTAVVDAMLGDIVSVQGSTKCYSAAGELLPRHTADFVLMQVPNEQSTMGQIKASYDE